MRARLRLQRDELGLVREALAFVGRRIFDPLVADRVGELEDELDRRLTDPAAPPVAMLALEGERLHALRTVLTAYADELDHPSTDHTNRVRIARLRELDRRLARRSGWRGRLAAWLPPWRAG
jgi:hypothetical protein